MVASILYFILFAFIAFFILLGYSLFKISGDISEQEDELIERLERDGKF